MADVGTVIGVGADVPLLDIAEEHKKHCRVVATILQSQVPKPSSNEDKQALNEHWKVLSEICYDLIRNPKKIGPTKAVIVGVDEQTIVSYRSSAKAGKKKSAKAIAMINSDEPFPYSETKTWGQVPDTWLWAVFDKLSGEEFDSEVKVLLSSKSDKQLRMASVRLTGIVLEFDLGEELMCKEKLTYIIKELILWRGNLLNYDGGLFTKKHLKDGAIAYVDGLAIFKLVPDDADETKASRVMHNPSGTVVSLDVTLQIETPIYDNYHEFTAYIQMMDKSPLWRKFRRVKDVKALDRKQNAQEVKSKIESLLLVYNMKRDINKVKVDEQDVQNTKRRRSGQLPTGRPLALEDQEGGRPLALEDEEGGGPLALQDEVGGGPLALVDGDAHD